MWVRQSGEDEQDKTDKNRIYEEKPFMSEARQPGVDVLQSWAVVLPQSVDMPSLLESRHLAVHIGSDKMHI